MLISPYLKFSRRIKEALKDQSKLWKTDVRIIYGKDNLRPEEYEWLADNEIRTYFREPLHAKCYMNENEALITSMNLYEFSQQNNDEMGILVSASDDPELYRDIKEEANRILRQSENLRLEVTRVEDGDDDRPWGQKDNTVRSEPQRTPASDTRQDMLPELGFCLRCGTEIPCSLDKPYCNSHYRIWARFKNENYEESHCHTCGEEHGSSMAKPLCLSCFRKYHSAFRMAS